MQPFIDIFHRQTLGDNAGGRSTVIVSFSKLQPKITKTHQMQQYTKTDGKWRGARYRQVKLWLIILIRIPEGKEEQLNSFHLLHIVF